MDAQPEFLFTLRQVDANDLVTQAAQASIKTRMTPARGKVLDESQLADVFGIEMAAAQALPDAKKKSATRPEKPMARPAVATKTSAKTSAKTATPSKPVTAAKKKAAVIESPFAKSKKPVAAKPLAPRKAAQSAPAKRASRPGKSDVANQITVKKART